VSTPTAHPYARISHPDQRKGGGLERQTTAALAEFCKRFGFALSKTVLVDDGVSAYKGLHLSPGHQLGRFLADARKGRVPPGDCLLIENYDRLSRQDVWAATALIAELRQLQIHVGRLDRMKLLRCDSTDPGDFFEAAVELMRGNSESEAKSLRNGAAWDRKRRAARESGKLVTRQLPAWVENHGDKLSLIPSRAAVVKEIFALAAAGYGRVSIVKRLTADGVPPFGEVVIREGRKRSAHSGRWTAPYVSRILCDRRAVGEYQPCGKGRKPEGPPVPGYFPAAVSEEEFWAAQAGRQARGGKRQTRQGKHVHLFSGLLVNARNGDSYIASSKPGRVLISYGSLEGRSPSWSFPLPIFEKAVLSLLREVSPAEVLGNGDNGDLAALSGEWERLEASLAALGADMDANGESPTLLARVRQKEARQRELAPLLAAARQKAAHPLSESWGEAQSLAAVLESAPDPQDARLRLRACLRRIVESVYLLVVPRRPRGRDRLCAAQFHFAGGGRRDFLIFYRVPGFHREAGWWAKSFAAPAGVGDLDLRRPADAKRLERLLAGLELNAL
jgi:DNA invertase Pin-like site-specific DNA recombinase